MNFKIDYDSRELEYDMINIKVNISLFMEMYMDIINKDLDYFKNKLGINCAITDNNREILDNYINNKEKNVRIKVNDKLDISIKENNYTYIVSYIIN